MTTDDLVAWLGKQLARDEVLAREAGDGDAGRWRAEAGIGGGCAQIRNEAGEIVVYDEGSPTNEEAAHIARHDPAAVLADVAARRMILVAYGQASSTYNDHYRLGIGTARECATTDALAQVVRLLALAYADRPGYRDEWRP